MRNIATCVCVCTVVGVFRDRVGDVFDCVAVLVGVSRRRRQRAIAQTTHIDAFDGERTIGVRSNRFSAIAQRVIAIQRHI